MDQNLNTVNRVDIEGEGLTLVEQHELADNIVATGLNADTDSNSPDASVSVVGSSSGGSSGSAGAGFPGDPASSAGGGAGSSATGQIGGSDGFFAANSKIGGAGGGGTTCETVLCLVREHQVIWQSSQLFDSLSSFLPGTSLSSLPVFCIPLMGNNICFDTAQFSFVFDAMRPVILIVAFFASFKIIILRTKT